MSLESATLAHALELAPKLRQADFSELEVQGLDPSAALVESVQGSDFCVALRLAGELAALFGVKAYPATILGARRVGCAWFLTGQACDKHPRELVRTARAVVPGLHRASGCQVLSNWVDSRYTGALRLLERLGFEKVTVAPRGALAVPFVLVSRKEE